MTKQDNIAFWRTIAIKDEGTWGLYRVAFDKEGKEITKQPFKASGFETKQELLQALTFALYYS